MIQIQQLKLPIGHTKEALAQKIAGLLGISPEQMHWQIVRHSIDARKKEEIHDVYIIEVETPLESKILRRNKNKNIVRVQKKPYRFPKPGNEVLRERPVIIGTGPAGLFCGYMLALHGYRPILLEQGEPARKRQQQVEKFWKTGELDIRSNVQFGEGGAGTFSDGKLNTSVKDPFGRNHEVLRIFVECGAPEEILYEQKPHLGTDVLVGIVEKMRQSIEQNGGEVRFGAKVTELCVKDGAVCGVKINDSELLSTELVIPAIGHSARDTFEMLYEKGLTMRPKAFAVGVRIEHPQALIGENQYGAAAKELPAASYKLTHTCENGHGVYSFCMCPGGYVVNASSEPEMLAVNGMSYQARDGQNANSAMIVTVTPEDYAFCHEPGTPEVFDGIAFQRRLERAAYRIGGGKIPVQLFGDFCENKTSTALGEIQPQLRGAWSFANLREIFPEFINEALQEGIIACDRKIRGFARKDALLSGVESRTSSPIRMVRDEGLEANIHGVYPCGEGAGYAGGITSAAMDGIKIAEKICERFMNFE